ncbi:MAG TPA: TonB-dependent receptor [Chitinophagaceae bacterium]|jgi:outer membrane receptor protein involved in Fe transport|nr:TonB-dependent receptor [Chitinophagaceae bacterium]
MYRYFRVVVLVLLLSSSQSLLAQTPLKGTIIDQATKEPVAGASIRCTDEGCTCGCASDVAGRFHLTCTSCKKHTVTATGYSPFDLPAGAASYLIELIPVHGLLQEIVVTANRGEGVRRSEAPIAIAVLNQRTINETKALSADQVLNKVSGVNMVNLGNEQHQMSIRQPITTRSLFLYLEDGIPVRTTGLFNHNALLEMNLAGVRSMEVIKGPSSSLYGSEAIGGVVNFLTLAPTAIPVGKLSLQGNTLGYKRLDGQTTFTKGRWGFALSGYYADKRNSFMEYSDFHKATVTARADYRISDKAAWSQSLTWVKYYSDMPSGVDSVMFATRKFMNPQTFTYRRVDALRYRSTFTQNWNERSKTTASLVYRSNAIGQNPNYRIKDDYRRVNGVFVGDKERAHGEINESAFRSYAFIGQHRQKLKGKKAQLVSGISVDLSPSRYVADYIRIRKDTNTRKYVSYQSTDSTLTRYATRINNYAAFGSFEFNATERLRMVLSLRYDLFRYRFDNALTPSAFSGSADTANTFRRLSPKVGITYNFSPKAGLYANYSEGFVPPQVTEMYTGVKVPYLQPSVFYNYEVGGWLSLLQGKVKADLSLYRLDGTNEIVSVRLDDGSFANQNAGRTAHKGVELGLNVQPLRDLSLRVSTAYSEHRFIRFEERGAKYNGNVMNNAPRWIGNTEVWYRPSYIKGLRIGAEWQHVGPYFADPQNTATYEGYDVLHLRAGYTLGGAEVWMNLMNAADAYYSNNTTRSAFGYSYQLAEPRSLVIGCSFDLAHRTKKK